MYRHFTAAEYKKRLLLPEDYKVDGVLAYGTLYEDRVLSILRQCLKELGTDAQPKLLEYPFLRFCWEVTVDDKTIWFMLGYGGAWLSEYIHWACLFGSQKNILIGSCGGLRHGAKRGDFIVPDASYGEESSVRMYNRESALQYADGTLSTSLRERLSDNTTTVWNGKIVTCQAMIGETREDVEQWSNQGYSAVEMESSTVFAVSQHFGVPAAASLYIGDNLIENQTNHSEEYLQEGDMRKQQQHKQMNAALAELFT